MSEDRFMDIVKSAPCNSCIVDNLVKAYSYINRPFYKKIICSISGGGRLRRCTRYSI